MGKNGGGFNPWLALGGLALAEHLLSDKEQKVVHVYEKDDSEYRAKEKLLDKEKKLLEKQQEIEKAKTPNSLENIRERIENDTKVATMGICSAYCFFMAVISAMAGFAGEFGFLFVAIILVFLGFAFKNIGGKEKEKKELYMQYISLIIVQGERNIVSIANEMNKSYEETYKDIFYIISHNYIKGFSINKRERTIVGAVSKKENNSSDKKENFINGKRNVRNNKCPACGGMMFVELDGGLYCKYCGARFE